MPPVSQRPSTPATGLETGPPKYQIQGSGPLLIYVAGLDGTGKLFFKQTEQLSRSYRVVTFRSRDHGRFTYEDLAGDVSAIIADQGESRATIVGESFGGTVALSFVLRYPSKVERLVIVNSFARFRQRVKIRLGVMLASVVPFRMTWPLRFVANLIGLRLDGVKRPDRQVFWNAISSVEPEAYARRLQLIAEFDVEDRLAEIQAPTLFIAGDRDLVIRSVKEAIAMAARMPNAVVKIIRGGGHAILLTDRVKLADILDQHDY